jgi:hypothetical protein
MNTQRPYCGWVQGRGSAEDLEGLHHILLCATRRGCDANVDCSERALELVLQATRSDVMRDSDEGQGN